MWNSLTIQVVKLHAYFHLYQQFSLERDNKIMNIRFGMLQLFLQPMILDWMAQPFYRRVEIAYHYSFNVDPVGYPIFFR